MMCTALFLPQVTFPPDILHFCFYQEVLSNILYAVTKE